MSSPPLAPKERKPEWLKVPAPHGETYARIKELRKDLRLATVCEEARCPNLGECWNHGTATFMVLGDTCTRACRFCNVKTGKPAGRLDHEEPFNLAHAVKTMGLSYVVITMVDRDDLPDGGAGHVVTCLEAVHFASPDTKIEVLAGDFRADAKLLRKLADSPASVLAHNVETVQRLTRSVRDAKSGYEQSLRSLTELKRLAPSKLTKSSIMLGLGETDDEVRATLVDLRRAEVEIVTLGQYLQPTPRHLPVVEYLPPARFEAWQKEAQALGFLFCASGPLVRSSYKAGELFTERWLRERDRRSGELHV